jgi:hypothetical protein
MRSVRRQITGAVWSIAVVLYFVISFTFGIWHVSWVIFIIAIAVDQLIRAFMSLKDYQ